MLEQPLTATRSIGYPDLMLGVTVMGDRSAVLEVSGAVHRSTAAALAAETFVLLYAAGFDRLSAVFVTRPCRESLDARLPVRRNRTLRRARVIDLTAGRNCGRDAVHVMTERPARWPVHGSAVS